MVRPYFYILQVEKIWITMESSYREEIARDKIPPTESKLRGEIDHNKTPVHGDVGGNRDNQRDKDDEKAQGKEKSSANMDKGVKGLPHQQVPQPHDFSSEALEKL